MPRSSGVACSICGQENVTKSLPKEIDRQLFHEEITVPAEPEPRRLKVAILRVTYQRDFLCTVCGHQWLKTFKTERQQHI